MNLVEKAKILPLVMGSGGLTAAISWVLIRLVFGSSAGPIWGWAIAGTVSPLGVSAFFSLYLRWCKDFSRQAEILC